MNPATAPEPKRPARKSGIVVPHQPKWHGRIAARTLWLLGLGLEKSWRLKINDQSGLLRTEKPEPVIFAVWHNRLAVAMPLWSWVQKKQPHSRLAALISASRDGGLLARTFQNFGVTPVRGSSSRRGAQALVELVSALRDGYHIAITPDGPRGPKYVVQSGIVSLAQLSGAPIIPVGGMIYSKKQFRSWDAFQVPIPFSRCDLTFSKPIYVARDATDEQMELARAQLEAELIRLSPD